MTVQEFVNELETQDTLCTARPIIIELQEQTVRFIPEGAYDYDGSAPAKDCPYLTEAPEDLGLDPEEVLYWKLEWVGLAWFLTHSGYEEHLKLNRHNYRKPIRMFIRHAFRSPEMVRVYQWLKEYAAVLEREKNNG